MVAIPDSSQDLLSIDEAISELATIRDFLRWSVSLFNEHQLVLGHGFDDPWDEAVALVLHALHLPWDTDVRIQDARVLPAERKVICSLLARRVLERVPSAYLTGVGWFAGIPFQVDQRVLIPRSPIGELIEKQFAPWIDPAAVESILDLCTGSGCIGIACAHQFEQAEVELLDISFDALEVADENIMGHQVSDRVMALQSDLFAAASGKYDLIVSNPPYVDADDMNSLPDEYHHEPELALAAGDDGLDLVRIMLKEARQYLHDDGLLVVEVGNSWPALAAAYPQLPFVWPEFERGGHGVFVLQAKDLDGFC